MQRVSVEERQRISVEEMGMGVLAAVLFLTVTAPKDREIIPRMSFLREDIGLAAATRC